MNSIWSTDLKGQLFLWIILQLFVATFIACDMLNNYSKWEDNTELSHQLDNNSAFSIALFSAIFTIISSAFLNLTIFILVVWVVYKLQKRWFYEAFTPSFYAHGIQYLVYGLMLSEIIKYFCVLLWNFTFTEWEELRQLINIGCLVTGCFITGLVWMNSNNQTNNVEPMVVIVNLGVLIVSLGTFILI